MKWKNLEKVIFKKGYLIWYFTSFASRKNWVFLAGEMCEYQMSYFLHCLSVSVFTRPPFFLSYCVYVPYFTQVYIYMTLSYEARPSEAAYQDHLKIRAASPLRQVLQIEGEQRWKSSQKLLCVCKLFSMWGSISCFSLIAKKIYTYCDWMSEAISPL